ncbi:MAG: iron-sulfur cluster assembly accessory protein [Nitrospirae bacterium]|nr:iron-sulfur cluster assembly accessory protein [Nitrospirota bacterium]
MIAFNGGEQEAGLRLSVKPGGCAGLTYDFSVETEPKPGDETIEGPDYRLYVPADCLPYLEGMTIDFSDTLMQSGLTFTNPNAAGTCGCGTSFSMEGQGPVSGESCGKR